MAARLFRWSALKHGVQIIKPGGAIGVLHDRDSMNFGTGIIARPLIYLTGSGADAEIHLKWNFSVNIFYGARDFFLLSASRMNLERNG